MKRFNFITTLLVIITILSLSFTIVNGFKFIKRVPNNFYGGGIQNKDSTGLAGLLLVVGEGATADTVLIYNSDTSFNIVSKEEILINSPKGLIVGGFEEQYAGGFASFNDSLHKIAGVFIYNNNLFKADSGETNTAMLSLGTGSPLSDDPDSMPHSVQIRYDYDSVFTGVTTRVLEGGWRVNAFGQVALSVDTLNKFGVGTGNPQVAVDIDGTDAIGIPVGNTSERPSPPYEGYLRYNTDSNAVEFYNGTIWDALN